MAVMQFRARIFDVAQLNFDSVSESSDCVCVLFHRFCFVFAFFHMYVAMQTAFTQMRLARNEEEEEGKEKKPHRRTR